MFDDHFFATELVDFRRASVRILSKLITSIALLLSVAIFTLCISIYFSFQTDEWHWFQRSGALVVCIGVILSTRRLLRTCMAGITQNLSHSEISRLFQVNTENNTDLQYQLDFTAGYYGFFVVGFGTLIWAYGDLINCIVSNSLRCSC